MKPKIIFRDVSIQHMSVLMPVYLELKKQGFDCELQYLNTPRWTELKNFIKKHENDVCDLLMTASVGDIIYSHLRSFSIARKKRRNSIFMSHGVGGEETPHYEYHYFKRVFLIGEYWMDLFTNLVGAICLVKCKHCGQERCMNFDRFGYEKFLKRTDWYCKKHKRKYRGASIYDHAEITITSGEFPLELIGFPKLDILVKPEGKKIAAELKNKYDLPYDKTVLYAPTLKRLDSFDKTALPLLKIFRGLDINLLIKTHCDDEDEEHQPETYKTAQKMAGSMNNVRWIGGETFTNIAHLYLISDVILSASSGCLREFMLVDKPSLQLTNVAQEIRTIFFYKGCAQINIGDLRASILRAVYVPEWYSKERHEEVKRLFHKPDGHATDRAVKKIKEIMNW